MSGAQPAHGIETCRSVLMVGTHLESTGGVRAVVQGYIEGGLFDRFDCTYVATHRTRGFWTKVLAALSGWAKAALRLATLDAPLVHVMLASRASFWRKSVICLLARLAGRPYLLHVHGAEFNVFYQQESGPLKKRFIRHVFSRAALVLALSEQWRTELQRICPVTPVEVLHNAVALPSAARDTELPEPDPTILFLGELGRRKGTYDLLHAFARIAGRCSRARLICAGDGDIRGVRALAAELRIADRIACPGWLDAERKRAALAQATVFVLPSYAEGMPMALIEAMSWGLPVVSSPVGGIPRLVSPEVNGLLVAPGDVEGLAAAIGRVLDDSALRVSLGRAARATVAAEFSLDGAIEHLARIYHRFGIRPKAPAVPTAHELFFSSRRRGDPAGESEDAFFDGLWVRHGTSKTTYHHRLDDLNRLVEGLLPPSRPVEIMDVAVSSGTSTVEWVDSLARAGIECRMVAGDAVIDAFLISAGERVRVLVDRTAFLMHLELAGRPVRLPPPRRCGARLHLHVFNLLRRAGAPLLRPALSSVQRSPPWARRLQISCRPLKLVSPSLAAHPSIEAVEDDILLDQRYPGRFHVVRAANILNRGYFDDATLERMVLNLRDRLRPLGLLVVCRSMPEHRNDATVFRLEEEGRFSAIARLNRGSEITELVLGTTAGRKYSWAASASPRDSSATG